MNRRSCKAIADSAVRQGARHLVYSSSGAAGKGKTGMGHFDSKSEIEAIQKCGAERVRITALHIVRSVGDQREGGGVAFGKTIGPEPFQLAEGPLGEFR